MINLINADDTVLTFPIANPYIEWVSPSASSSSNYFIDDANFSHLYSFVVRLDSPIDNLFTTYQLRVASSDDTVPTTVFDGVFSTLTNGDNVKVLTHGEISIYCLKEADYIHFYAVDIVNDVAKTLVDVGLFCDGVTPIKKVGV